MTTSTRYGPLSAATRARARSTAIALGERLLQEPPSASPNEDPWLASRSLGGSSGYALAFMALSEATSDSRFEAGVHAFIRRAASVDDAPEIGLYTGIGGLRAVVALASQREPRYGPLLAQCDAYIEEHIPPDPLQPTSFGDYDLITGWSGTRLALCVEGRRPPDALIRSLAWTLENDERWKCVHPVRGGDPEHDLGVAHGVAGMLAAMVLTLDDIEAFRPLMVQVAHELAQCAVERDGVLWWPHTRTHDDVRFRAAWCYGTPGVAAVLHATGTVLGDSVLADFALEAAESLALATNEQCVIDEANLCHGTVGNALCVASIAAERENRTLDRLVERYVTDALDDLEKMPGTCISRQDDGKKYETFDELVGAAGVILGLLTLSGECDASWMRLHGLNAIA